MVGEGKKGPAIGQQVVVFTGIFFNHSLRTLAQGLEERGKLGCVPVIPQQVIPEILKGSGRVAHGFLKGGVVAFVRFNGRCFSVMGEYPVVTAESEDKGMGVAIVYGAAATKTDMADNNSAFYHPG